MNRSEIFASLGLGEDQPGVGLGDSWSGGEPFEAVAREASEDEVSAPKGGELGAVREGQVHPGFFEAVARLRDESLLGRGMTRAALNAARHRPGRTAPRLCAVLDRRVVRRGRAWPLRGSVRLRWFFRRSVRGRSEPFVVSRRRSG